MDQDEQRDYEEESYWRDFCPACGESPCGWDGEPDGFHTDNEALTGEDAADKWRDAVEAFHGVGDYAIDNQDF